MHHQFLSGIQHLASSIQHLIMEYNFRSIEEKWQQQWNETNAYKVSNDSLKPKFYVLDMFPYPSGAGLHVGHPLGYIASDIYARFKRLKGFNVLHPMGYDSFGLPAEQYALETGQHPAVTTEKNIATFRSQLDKIGFCFDWSRQVKTSDPSYYKWTQWIFLQLFNSYYNRKEQKAKPIAELIKKFEMHGSADDSSQMTDDSRKQKSVNSQLTTVNFSASEWNSFEEKKQQDILMNHRLAFCGYGEVNWCEALGTVLANDEVVNGVSERGGYPVVKRKLRQWYLRITEYADRLLDGLNTIQFSEAMKEMQSNWIGKSSGAEISFEITTHASPLTVYTTRPDTIFGVDFMVIAPEHELVDKIKSTEQTTAVDEYIAYVKSRSERERMAEKKITGCFTGAYAINTFDGKQIPIWISEYVLAGYGTGAIMAVPCGDERDFKFAKHFNIPITNIIGKFFNGEEANPTKEATLENSDFLNGLLMKDAMEVAINKIESLGIGKRKINYKMRDAAFSRQRYWGEPFPITWHDGIATALDENELPLELPYVEKYGPGPDGEGPLANIPEWVARELETNTMPGYAGSSWYFLRYMDPENDQAFCDRKASDYWNQVDLYVGGTEHAVGHLLYSRMWTKVLFDLGHIGFDEPFKKLLNQGMIQGSSRLVYRMNWGFKNISGVFVNPQTLPTVFLSHSNLLNTNSGGLVHLSDDTVSEIIKKYKINRDMLATEFFFDTLHVDVNIVNGVELDMDAFRNSKPNYKEAVFICEDGSVNSPSPSGEGSGVRGKYICGVETEKMSKRYFNTVDPSDLCDKYGADTFRMYEMFLGPVEASKPWDTKGIEGVYRFLKKLWRLFFDEIKGKVWNEEKATDAELKVLHKTIKKIEGDTETFAYNTAVSAFMVCVNELTDLKCNKKEVLEQLLVLLTPYAPHISEELWSSLGKEGSILNATYPTFNEKYLVESEKEYPISINGKVRTNISIATNVEQPEVEKIVLANDVVQKWLEGKAPKKFIFVKNKMINLVI